MAKTYIMGDGALSEDQKESVKNFTEQQDQQVKEMVERELKKEEKDKVYTLEQLLKTRLQPTEDRVVVYPDPVAKVTDGGIHKPDEVVERERPLHGTVLAVGQGRNTDASVTNMLLLAILRTTDIPDNEFEKIQELTTVNQVNLNPGDRVMYGRYAGTDIEDPATGAKLLILRPGDIFVKL
jgi:co-chaperonin GroES (HSP10)